MLRVGSEEASQSMYRIVLPLLGVGLLVAACTSPEPFSRSTGQPGFTAAAVDSEPLAARMNRGDWMVATKSRIWKVFENQPSGPERHVGYLVGSKYRQVRGGPEFTMYKVTTLDRNDQIGHIDQVGRAVRYEPRRDGEFVEVPVGSSTREENLASIFDTRRTMRVEATNEIRLAFEALDDDGDGRLSRTETADWSGRVASADANNDGFVDFEEFAELERF